MSKALDLLRRLASGDNRGDFFISNELLKEIEELLAQPEQEPVAWIIETEIEGKLSEWVCTDKKHYMDASDGKDPIPLYTAPPKREPIEDGELEVWYSQHTWAMDKQEYIWGFRDAEKAHGIGGGECVAT